MRSMSCQNIRSEIEAAGSVDYLSQAAAAHINSCAACETLSRQQSRLHSILSNLGTVEAPGDFDFKLRARLATEKAAKGNSFSLWRLSFSQSAAAVATILLLIGAAVVYVGLRTPAGDSVATKQGEASAPQSGTVSPTEKVSESAVATSAAPAKSEIVDKKRGGREFKSELLAQSSSRSSSKVQSSRPARVLKYGELAETYPSAPFQINASYQALKVSVDDGSGVARTISLPSVSFGSQSGLAQNASPQMAMARGTW